MTESSAVTRKAVMLPRADGTVVRFRPTRLVVAGYTGRDRAAVDRHVQELADAGIAPPDRIPTYFELSSELAVSTAVITPDGDQTSGEVEPVLLFTDEGPRFAVGSDHTDRDLERDDVAQSKAACPKVFSAVTLDYDEVVRDWDRCRLRSWAGDDPYQDAPLSEITPAPETLEDLTRATGTPPAPGLVLFLGTVPLLGASFAYTDRYRMSLTTPAGQEIELSYRVLARS